MYALDIETSTDGVNGLDPSESHITSVAVYDGEDGVVFDGPEATLLVLLEQHIAALTEGVIVTWNGASFDLPWLSDRFAVHGIATTLEITLSDDRTPSYDPIPGHKGGYLGQWGKHDHLDIMQQYRMDAKAEGLRYGLKPTARRFGIEVIEVDRENMHLLTREEEHAYVLSDVVATYKLASYVFDLLRNYWCDSQILNKLAAVEGDLAA